MGQASVSSRIVGAQFDGPPIFGFRFRPAPVFLQGVSKLRAGLRKLRIQCQRFASRSEHLWAGLGRRLAVENRAWSRASGGPARGGRANRRLTAERRLAVLTRLL